MKIFYCRVGWMKKYKGYVDNDRPVNGGKYNETHIGHEVYNFLPHDGVYYGFVQSGNIAIEKLGTNVKIQRLMVFWLCGYLQSRQEVSILLVGIKMLLSTDSYKRPLTRLWQSVI